MLPNYILLDLETTGAIPLRDRITEIALIHFKNGIEVDRWQTLVNPKIHIFTLNPIGHLVRFFP